MKANDMQVAGSHYKAAFQHWDWVGFVNLPYLSAQVTKYLTRWRKKNGLQDVEKSHHFLLKYIEEEIVRHEDAMSVTKKFLLDNEVGTEEAAVMDLLVRFQLGDIELLRRAAVIIQRLMDDERKKV